MGASNESEFVEYLDSNRALLKIKEFQLFGVKQLYAGEVCRVFISPETGDSYTAWLCKNRGEKVKLYNTSEALLTHISQLERYQLIDKLTESNTFSAILAYTLAIAIVTLALTRGYEKIDPALAGAFSLVVGFYFGKRSNE